MPKPFTLSFDIENKIIKKIPIHFVGSNYTVSSRSLLHERYSRKHVLSSISVITLRAATFQETSIDGT